MSKISKAEYDLEEYKVQLKNHDYWCKYSWQDDICKQALKDREKLEKIEQIIEIVNNANAKTDNSEIKINNKAFAFFDIEQIVKG